MTENTRRIAELQREVAANPASRQFYQLGELMRRDGMWAEAAEVLRAGLTYHPRYVAAWVALGRAFLEGGKGADAIRGLGHALELDAQNPVAWRLLGEAHLALGQRPAALEAMRRCLELVPGDDVLEAAVEALTTDTTRAAAVVAVGAAPAEPGPAVPGPGGDIAPQASPFAPPAEEVAGPLAEAAPPAPSATTEVMDVFGELPTKVEPLAAIMRGVEPPAPGPSAAEPFAPAAPPPAPASVFELPPEAPPEPVLEPFAATAPPPRPASVFELPPEAPPEPVPEPFAAAPASEPAPLDAAAAALFELPPPGEAPPAAEGGPLAAEIAAAAGPGGARPAEEPFAPAAIEPQPPAPPADEHLFTAPPAEEAPALLRTVLTATSARTASTAVQQPATLALARLYVQQQALDEAVVVLERLLEREPENVEAQDLLALVRDMMAPLPEAPPPLALRERKIAALQRWLASLTLGRERAAR